ncbi:helix-hairpin-helix domain-containing protein [Streptomyces boninensis]|uniref:helix-hairpin-helix domain-containing protein n=1 Tax=Streptomyces boninensis TaxID=2039455 RepID=UPI003B21E0AE
MADGDEQPQGGATDAAPGADGGEEPQGSAASGDGGGQPQDGGRASRRAGGAGTAGPADGDAAGTEEDAAGAEGDAAGDGGAAEEARRERIPVEAGKALSGQAADLLAAVRAVERGERDASSFYAEPRPRPQPRPAASVPAARGASASPGAALTGPEPGPEPGPADESTIAAVREVLTSGGAPEALAPQVARSLGPGAADALRADPWELLTVPGIRPEQADGFARALLGADCGPADDRRAAALVGWLLEQAAVKGHTALETSVLQRALGQNAVPDPEAAVRAAVEAGTALVFQEPDATAEPVADEDGEEHQPVRILLGLERLAVAEEGLADGLTRLVSTFATASTAEAEAPAPSDWDAAAGSAPSPSAAELIRAAAAAGLVLHSGGEAARAEPAALVSAARSLGLRAYTASHTLEGRARMAELLGESASAQPAPATTGSAPQPAPAAVTISGLLAGSEGPGFDAEGVLALDLLAVTDAPLLDVEAAAALVEALPDGARLVLSGDPAGLEATGPGRVFADLAAARGCPAIVSRTPDPGPIGELVSGIGIGELAEVEAPGKEVVIVPARDAAEAVHRAVQLVADSVPRAFGVPAGEVQVIAVGHGGAAGTRALNAALKERINPGPGKFGGFDAGDRVVYVPAPGRALLGSVASADDQGLRLRCPGRQEPLTIRPDAVAGGAVRHGWALTAHQAAGRRWPAAVVVVPGDPGTERALTRSWAYTAFGRGERHLSVVHGAGPALARAIAEVPGRERTTRLRELLRPQPVAVAE